MKKALKKCTSLLLLLTLLTAISPVTSTSLSEDTESGIMLLGDDDNENMNHRITNY